MSETNMPNIEPHHNKTVNITPETGVSFNLIALFAGLILGGGISYGVMTSRLNTQNDQIKEVTSAVKELTTSVNTLNTSAARQEIINKTFVDTLSDYKSTLDKISADVNAIRRGR